MVRLPAVTMKTATLNWYADRGFELDVEASEDDVAIRLAAVPVPADGTDELRSGVDLDRLDILFKASVELHGEPAQLQDARVQLAVEDGRDVLHLEAKCEDVETGEIVPVTFTVPVALPSGAPASGGPRPVPTNEDDLDWEDETTLEKMVVNAPETPSTDLDADSPKPASGKGLQALLKALASLDDEEDFAGEDEEPPAEPPPEPTPTKGKAKGGKAKAPKTEAQPKTPKAKAPKAKGGKAKGAQAAPAERFDPGEDADGPDQSLGAEGEARSLLELLLNNDHLELEGDGEIDGILGGVAEILALPLSSEAKAKRLSGWLLEQEQVADLFIDDDDLAEILERW